MRETKTLIEVARERNGENIIRADLTLSSLTLRRVVGAGGDFAQRSLLRTRARRAKARFP